MERGKGYGRNPSADQPSWQQKMISMHELDHQRLHLVGPLPHRRMLRVMQISTAHVYLTVPFVLSWSVLEAMAAGCLVVGSNTEPVREIIQHEHNGLLVDFFSAEAIADAVIEALEQRDDFVELRNCARDTVLKRYSLDTVMPLHMALIDDLAAGRIPPPTHQTIEAFQLQQTSQKHKTLKQL
jgi:glycosyltransferase involved in cell wall biosynthesis